MRPSFAFGRVVAVAACLIISSLSQAVGEPGDERPEGAETFGQVLSDLNRVTGGPNDSRDPKSLKVEFIRNEGSILIPGQGTKEILRYRISRNIVGPEFNTPEGRVWLSRNVDYFRAKDVRSEVEVYVPAGTKPEDGLHDGYITRLQKTYLYRGLRATPFRREERERVLEDIRRVENKQASWDNIQAEAVKRQEITEELGKKIKEEMALPRERLAEYRKQTLIMERGEAIAFNNSRMMQWGVEFPPKELRDLKSWDEREIDANRAEITEDLKRDRNPDEDPEDPKDPEFGEKGSEESRGEIAE